MLVKSKSELMDYIHDFFYVCSCTFYWEGAVFYTDHILEMTLLSDG